MLSHVVFFWTKPSAADAVTKLLEGIEQYLRPIPGVISLHAGTMVPSDRPVVEQSYQVGLLIQLPDKAAEVAYQKHPKHVEFVEKYVRVFVERVVVYDFAG